MRVSARWIGFGVAAALAAVTQPAAAQFSPSYNFLKAVRDADGDKVTQMLQSPQNNVINTRDFNTGESALHIVVKRRDVTYLTFLLAKGARPDIKDNQGNTPLIAAAQLGFGEGISPLIEYGANVNAVNDRGENALILAVQARDLTTVRLLLASGANPKAVDHIAGMSARDYAAQDRRSAAILKVIDETPAQKPKGNVAGPQLK
jgi:ankyrin repeat protein